MKKFFTLLLFVIIRRTCFSQDANFNNLSVSNLNKNDGAYGIYGWGNGSDNSKDSRPNFRPDATPFMINNHSGLTFSAHSFYGGIRFYNQGYPNAFDPATGSVMVMAITNGNVGIGTPNPDAKLAVNGSIHAKEVRVDLNVPGADYVFDKSYPLPSLNIVNKYIRANRHLPGVPSAKSMEKSGIDVSAMNITLLQKVEELTLYMIKQEKRIRQLEANQKKH